LQGEDADRVRTLLEAQAGAGRELASRSPFATPTPVALGNPGHGFPLPWSVQTWIPGHVADAKSLAGSSAFAEDLATLIRALRRADTKGRRFSGAGRGASLPDHDGWLETCFQESEKLLDVDGLRRLWAEFRELPEAGTDVMCHGDLIPANLLVHEGRLVSVLDGGGFGPADPSRISSSRGICSTPTRGRFCANRWAADGSSGHGPSVGVRASDGTGLVLPGVKSGNERTRQEHSQPDPRRRSALIHSSISFLNVSISFGCGHPQPLFCGNRIVERWMHD
jgi:hypothetical protein